MKRTGIELNMTVDEIMRRWPVTIRVFIRYRMLCIGCPIGIFHTVKDACEAHDLDREIFSGELLSTVRDDEEIELPSGFEVLPAGEQPRARPPQGTATSATPEPKKYTPLTLGRSRRLQPDGSKHGDDDELHKRASPPLPAKAAVRTNGTPRKDCQ